MKKRIIWQKVKEYLNDDRTIVITGPRRVGKTTTIKWALGQLDSKNSHYFDLENVTNRDLFLTLNYDTLINEFGNLGLNTKEKMYLAIDEIQYVKNLPSIVKYLQDNYNIKFLLSGSSSFYLKNLFSESLSGRKVIIEMFPLSFSEFLIFQEVDYQISFDYDNPTYFSSQTYQRLNSYYEEYIQYGGLPQVVVEKSVTGKRSILEDIYSSYINLDVQSLSDFKSLEEFRKLVRLLAARVGSKLNTSELASILGINRVTVESYLEFMKKTYLIRAIPIYSQSIDIISRKQEKVYFIDNGILNINADTSSGARFENIISTQLSYRNNLYYYEDNSKEIDFILDNKYAIEVKETPTQSDLRLAQKRASVLKLQNTFIVGKNINAGFDQYIWGGLIN